MIKVNNLFNSKIYFYFIFVLVFTVGLLLGGMKLNLPSYSGWFSLVFLVFSACLVYYGLIKNLNKKSLFSILLLSLLALIIEYGALISGFPYGDFRYTSLAGPKMFGVLPISVAFAWPPLVVGSYVLFSDLSGVKRFLYSVLFLVALDLVIDPAAVEFGLWNWASGGLYYGIPAQNYFGWLVSGTVGVGILDRFLNLEAKKLSILVFFSVLLNLFFWSGFLLANKIFFPVLVALFLLCLFYYRMKKIKEGAKE